MTDNPTPAGFSTLPCRVHFVYTNWRGETAVREATASLIWIGKSEWHPGKPQWFMRATDLRTGQERDFAMLDMSEVAWEPKL